MNKTIIGKKSHKWDGDKFHSNFTSFQKSKKAFDKALKLQDWADAKIHGLFCINIKIDNFNLREVQIYNKNINRIRNGINSLPVK